MTARSLGDEAQIRALMEQVGKAAAAITITEFVAQHPEVRRGTVVSEIPAPLKWAGGVAAAVFTAASVAMAMWMVSTLSDLQQTVTRIDERQKLAAESGDSRFREIERRVTQLEAYHSGGGG